MKIKPMQVAGWLLQAIGAGLVFVAVFTDAGFAYGPKFKAILLLLAYFFVAYGRKIYLPAVKLLKECPKCGREIRVQNTVCPHCDSNLHVTTRFPGVADG